mgnify:CR=1 FL=1
MYNSKVAKVPGVNPIEFENLYADLNKKEYKALNLEMFESAITVLKNEDEIIPIKRLDKEKIAFVKIGDGDATTYIEKLKEYAQIDVITTRRSVVVVPSLHITPQNPPTQHQQSQAPPPCPLPPHVCG